MSKQSDKNKVEEAEKLLQELLDQNSLSLKEIQELSKNLQKLNSGSQKKKEENLNTLMNFLSNKPKIKEYFEQDESNSIILGKASQKIISKNKPKEGQDKENNKENSKASQSLFTVKKNNLVEIFNKEGEKYFKDNEDNLFIYFETLTKDKLEKNELPLYSMIFYPKDKKIIFYIKSKGKLDLSFSQVDYLCDPDNGIFLNIDYFSMIENCEMEKGREYKKNILDMDKVEKFIKELKIFDGNEIKVIPLNNDEKLFKKEFCQCCNDFKQNIKEVITNNKDFFNELFV